MAGALKVCSLAYKQVISATSSYLMALQAIEKAFFNYSLAVVTALSRLPCYGDQSIADRIPLTCLPMFDHKLNR